MSDRFRLLALLVPLCVGAVVTACSEDLPEGSDLVECSDRADNDSDGLFDCDDPDCAEAPDCLADPGDDDDVDSSLCTDSEVFDCNGHCAPAQWIGDGQCDNESYAYYGNFIDYNCVDHDFDGGDCEGVGDDDDSGQSDDDDGHGDDDDDDDDGHGDDDGGGMDWTFTEVWAVVSSSCSCHAGTSHDSGQAFNGSQSTLYSIWVGSSGTGVPSSEASSMNRIEPGDATQSYVMHKLDGTQATAGGWGARMPFNGPYLTQDERDGIRGWINAGAPDN